MSSSPRNDPYGISMMCSAILPGFSIRWRTPIGMQVDGFSSSRTISFPRVLRAGPGRLKAHDFSPVLVALLAQKGRIDLLGSTRYL